MTIHLQLVHHGDDDGGSSDYWSSIYLLKEIAYDEKVKQFTTHPENDGDEVGDNNLSDRRLGQNN